MRLSSYPTMCSHYMNKMRNYKDFCISFLKLYAFLISGCIWLLLSNAEAKSWICIADQSVGFEQHNGAWKAQIFTTSTKIIIKPLDFSDKDSKKWYDTLSRSMFTEEKWQFSYVWHEFGIPFPIGLCDAGIYENVIHCRDGGVPPNEEITVDLLSMKFQHYHPYGYLFQNDKTEKLTPAIEIGTCTEL